MKTLTIRNLPEEIAAALERERHRRGQSLNRTVIELLSQGLGVGHSRSNGLSRLGGKWNADELEEFESAVARFEDVDPEIWR